MAGFKLGVFDREAHLIGPQESGCSTIGRSQKAVWILAHMDKERTGHPYGLSICCAINIVRGIPENPVKDKTR